MKITLHRNKFEPISLKAEKTESNQINKMTQALLRLVINFWRFSCYYAEYKDRMRGH